MPQHYTQASSGPLEEGLCTGSSRDSRPTPSPPNRIEILPIRWYNCIHDTSNSLLKTTLNSITLNAVPELRMVANEIILFDVLMYLTLEYCQEVLEFVTDQITSIYTKFQTIHQDFVSSRGNTSLLAILQVVVLHGTYFPSLRRKSNSKKLMLMMVQVTYIHIRW